MKNLLFPLIKKKGSVLLISLIFTTVIGGAIGSLYDFSNSTSILLEKQYASTQAMFLSEGALALRQAVITAKTPASGEQKMSLDDIKILEDKIKAAFLTVSTRNFNGILDFESVISNPTNSDITDSSGVALPGFKAEQTVYAVYRLGSQTGSFRSGMESRMGLTMNIKLVPAFSLLSFYNEDFEVAESWENCNLFGRIHCNANVFLNGRMPDWDPLFLHTPVGTPSISAVGKVYRRARSGLETEWIADDGGYNAKKIRFVTHTAGATDWDVLFNEHGLYTSNNTTEINFTRDITENYKGTPAVGTTPAIAGTTSSYYRRFPHEDYYYIKKAEMETGGTMDKIISATNSNKDKSANYLSPPVTLKPYQYVEDIQYYDIWDTNSLSNWAQDRKYSNFSEDSDGKLKKEAFCARAGLVIRDGVAYFRTTPGGTLSVVSPTGISTKEGTSGFYPSNTHPQRKKYSDLRWYGWFGMNEGVSPTRDNPARWHFPLRSVTFIDGKASAWNGSAATKTPNKTIGFTYDSPSVRDPESDAFTNFSTFSGPHFIDTTRRMDQVYSKIQGHANGDTRRKNQDFPYLDPQGNDYWPREAFHPDLTTPNADLLRAQYVQLKQEVRRMVNAHHIYTSQHNGTTLLTVMGNTPDATHVMDVWGTTKVGTVDVSNGPEKANYGYSAFWNDDYNPATLKVELFPFGHPTVYNDEVEAEHATTTSSGLSFSSPYVTGFNKDTDEQLEFRNAGTITGLDIYYASTKDATLSLSDNNGSAIDITTKGALPGEFITLPSTGNTAAYKYLSGIAGNTVITFDTSTPHGSKPFSNLCLKIKLKTSGELRIDKIKLLGAISSYGILKSTLPLSDRTIPMPSSSTGGGPSVYTAGFTWVGINAYSGNNTQKAIVDNRRHLYKFWGINNLDPYSMNNSATGTLPEPKNAYRPELFWKLNNYPEALKRSQSPTEFSADRRAEATPYHVDKFWYNGSEHGGYYGNDNLCMFNEREKKFVVFTEIDLSEFTPECLSYNGLSDILKSESDAAKLTNGPTNSLENAIYVVNSTVGKNFYGREVHCGAVRIKRGETFWTRLSIVSPNPVYIWGDLNCPDYTHQFTQFSSYTYNVPTTFHGTARVNLPFAIYADSINGLPNNWFRGNGTSLQNKLRYSGNTALSFSAPSNGDVQTQSNIMFDSSLWWEDDGQRVLGKGNKRTNADLYGAAANGSLEDYINYTWLIFENPEANTAGEPPFIRTNLPMIGGSGNGEHREHQTPMACLSPMAIYSCLFYGQVLSSPPVWFDQSDITGIKNSKPAGISDLEWYLDQIPMDKRIPLTGAQLSQLYKGNASGDEGTNQGSTTVKHLDGNNRSVGMDSKFAYYGLVFPSGGSEDNRFERFKGYFQGGSLNNALRFHQYYHHNLGGDNALGLYVKGSFVCLFNSRQDTNFYSSYLLSEQMHQLYFRFDPGLTSAKNLPPGTPMMVQNEGSEYFKMEGSKYR